LVVAPLVRDAESGETEACGSDARNEVRVQLSGRGFIVRPIEDLSAGGIDLLAEEEAGSVLHFIEKCEVVITEQSGIGGLGGGCGLHLSE
jgi:hypothetical protein